MKKVMCPICIVKEGKYSECVPIDELFWKCPCGAEVWPPEWEEEREIEPNNYRSCSLPEGVKIHGGEKRNGKNPALAKMSKKPLSEINQGLYKS